MQHPRSLWLKPSKNIDCLQLSPDRTWGKCASGFTKHLPPASQGEILLDFTAPAAAAEAACQNTASPSTNAVTIALKGARWNSPTTPAQNVTRWSSR
jgi:hypothetical protein